MGYRFSDKMKAAYVIHLFTKFDFYNAYKELNSMRRTKTFTHAHVQIFVSDILYFISCWDVNSTHDNISLNCVTQGNSYKNKLILSCGNIVNEIQVRKISMRFPPKTKMVIDSDEQMYIFSYVDKMWYNVSQLGEPILDELKKKFFCFEEIEQVKYYKPD